VTEPASPSSAATDPKKQLRRAMGFWDLLLFNVASVLGPRWIAVAANNGSSSISLWVLAAVLFFLPTTLILTELSTRFPEEGGLYVWTKKAFGEFHGFVAGWTYWVYTFFYFPGLLMASVAMSVYAGGNAAAHLADNRTFLLAGSFLLLFAAVALNIVGVGIGKWLQNAGGIGTYLPLLMLIGMAAYLWHTNGSATHFTWPNVMPRWNWDTLNFWPKIAFAYSGIELASSMSEEVRNPQTTFPRAIFGSAISIVLIYVAATMALLAILPAHAVDPKAGVFQALTAGSVTLRIGFFGIIAAVFVTFGNAGGVGSTVAGVARIPFVVGIDRYMPAIFGKIHPKWRTPWVAMLVQAVISLAILFITQLNETADNAYYILVDATNILYFIPFVYIYFSVIRLAYVEKREARDGIVLIPGGKIGVWLAGSVASIVTLGAIVLSFVPETGEAHKWLFETKLIAGTLGGVLFGLVLYWRGARAKAREAAQSAAI
jgi:amino acid transporter